MGKAGGRCSGWSEEQVGHASPDLVTISACRADTACPGAPQTLCNWGGEPVFLSPGRALGTPAVVHLVPHGTGISHLVCDVNLVCFVEWMSEQSNTLSQDEHWALSEDSVANLFLKKTFIYLFGCSGSYCGMQDLVPWPGTEPRPSAVGAQNLIHWTTREVPQLWILMLPLSSSPGPRPGCGTGARMLRGCSGYGGTGWVPEAKQHLHFEPWLPPWTHLVLACNSPPQFPSL